MTRQFHICVAPVAGGWALNCGQDFAPMMFLSRACAEQQAHALAGRLNASGGSADVEVRRETPAPIRARRLQLA